MVYVAPEVDSDDENVEYEDESGHRYRLYLDELEAGSNPGASCKDTSGEIKVLQGKNHSKLLRICLLIKFSNRKALVVLQ